MLFYGVAGNLLWGTIGGSPLWCFLYEVSHPNLYLQSLMLAKNSRDTYISPGSSPCLSFKSACVSTASNHSFLRPYVSSLYGRVT